MVGLLRTGSLGKESQRPGDGAVAMSLRAGAVVTQNHLSAVGAARDRDVVTCIECRQQRRERRGERRGRTNVKQQRGPCRAQVESTALPGQCLATAYLSEFEHRIHNPS